MLTVNLDRLAARSFAETHPGAAFNEMTGRQAPRRIEILTSGSPYLVNLHGTLEDASTWVLTRRDLGDLLGDRAYAAFIDTIFATSTVVFYGVSADDVATGGLLSDLRSHGLDVGQHFWLTHRNDAATDRWAEDAGIQVIRYVPEPSHEAALDAFCADLARFVSTDDPDNPPLSLPAAPARRFAAIPDPSTLAGTAPETIRLLLSEEAARILAPGTREGIDEYRGLRVKYRRAIHNAWFVSKDPPDNQFFGHEILDEIGAGAFANVYRARSHQGEEVAIKLLRAEIGQDERMIGSFRRGVRSMRILSERGIEGTVKHLEAHELPACSVMEFIHGPNLQQAVEAHLLTSWPDALRIGLEVARIVRAGHLLPEQVLHRDLRPPNIMLKDFYSAGPAWRVIVLDFDLSWHRGATEESVDLKAASALAYLSPEQLQLVNGVSTRSAAVDAYGLGMTLFFLLTGSHPVPGQANGEDWEQRIRSMIRLGSAAWHSAPARAARLIARATRWAQNQRLDFGEIVGELERLNGAVTDPAAVRSAELWSEEILARALEDDSYRWNHDLRQVESSRPGGLRLALRAMRLTRGS